MEIFLWQSEYTDNDIGYVCLKNAHFLLLDPQMEKVHINTINVHIVIVVKKQFIQ